MSTDPYPLHEQLVVAIACALACACACQPEPDLLPTPDAFASVPEIVTGISVHSATRRLEAARGDTHLPFTFRYSDGAGSNPRTCRQRPELRAALARLMVISVTARIMPGEEARVAAIAAHNWVAIEVRNTLTNVGPTRLRVLPPAPDRPRAYAKSLGSTRYFVTDPHLLDVLALDCRAR